MDRREPHEIRVVGEGGSGLLRELLDCFVGDSFGDRETYCSVQPDDNHLDAQLSSECFFALVAMHAGRVVGGLAGHALRKLEQPRSELYIYDLAVTESHRRRGIATALLERVEALARDRGARPVLGVR